MFPSMETRLILSAARAELQRGCLSDAVAMILLPPRTEVSPRAPGLHQSLSIFTVDTHLDSARRCITSPEDDCGCQGLFLVVLPGWGSLHELPHAGRCSMTLVLTPVLLVTFHIHRVVWS